jgi:hypothetical protein
MCSRSEVIGCKPVGRLWSVQLDSAKWNPFCDVLILPFQTNLEYLYSWRVQYRRKPVTLSLYTACVILAYLDISTAGCLALFSWKPMNLAAWMSCIILFHHILSWKVWVEHLTNDNMCSEKSRLTTVEYLLNASVYMLKNRWFARRAPGDWFFRASYQSEWVENFYVNSWIVCRGTIRSTFFNFSLCFEI